MLLFGSLYEDVGTDGGGVEMQCRRCVCARCCGLGCGFGCRPREVNANALGEESVNRYVAR